MKANAPEKIWLNLIPHTEEVRIVYTEQPIGRYCKSIEYTRTDAFIEKALKWFKEHNEAIAVMGFIPDYYIEDFINYMKGE